MAETAVRVRGLRKRYRDVAAVDGLDLDIARGEVFALLGPNGAGKTTTVEILDGYRARDGGEVEVLGGDPARADRAWRTRIGIVLQTSSEAPELTVREVVRHFAGYYPSPRDLLLIFGAIFNYDIEGVGVPFRQYLVAGILIETAVLLSIGALLGVAVSSLPRTARTASAVTTLPYICLQFISGVFFPFGQLPGFLRTIAAVFPLKWLCQGLRSVFLPDRLLAVEPAHAWEHGRTALVLLAWCAGGLVLCMTTFRWTRRGDG